MVETERINRFLEVYELVFNLLNSKSINAKKAFLSLSFLVRAAAVMILISVFGLSVAILLTRLFDVFDKMLELYFSWAQTSIRPSIIWIMVLLSMIGIGFLLSFPGIQLGRQSGIVANTAIIMQALLIAPFWAVTLQYILDYFVGISFVVDQYVQTVLLTSILLSVFFILCIVVLYFVLILVPISLFLVLTSASDKTFFSISTQNFPSYHTIILSIIQEISLKFGSRGEEFLEDVLAVTKQRSTALSAQVQTFALSTGLIGLISVLVIFTSNDQIVFVFSGIDVFLAQIQTLSGLKGDQSFKSAYFFSGFALLVLLIFLLIGWRYFTYSYKVLRVLEIVEVFADTRLTKLRAKKTRPLNW